MTAATAPAIGYSIVSNLGGDRQMTVQCFVAEDESDDVVHARIDRVFRVVDRQRARYEIVDKRKELLDHTSKLAQLDEDLARIEQDFQKAQASLDVQLAEVAEKRSQAIEEARIKHHAGGRQGAFSPGKNVTSNFDSAAAQIKASKDKNAAERDVSMSQVEVTRKRWIAEIERITAEIEERQKLLGE